MKLTGDKEGLANYYLKRIISKLKSLFERDLEEKEKVYKTRFNYAVRNEKILVR